MRFLYSIGIAFLATVIRIASWWNPKAKKAIEGRKSLWDNLPDVSGKKVIWFHCASLGEFDQATPLIELIKSRNPTYFVLVTFFSPSGIDHYKKRNINIDFACYLPFDSKNNARRFISYFNPSVTIFVKYEFWSNFIFELKRNQSKIFSISTILRPNHRFFKPWGGFFRYTLKQFDHFYVQNQESKTLLSGIGINQVTITGDNRYDKVVSNLKNLKANPTLDSFIKDGAQTLIIGSCWPDDEVHLLPALSQLSFDKIIIAPHNVDDSSVKSIEEHLNEESIRFTQYNESDASKRILILDTIGHLSSAYHYGEVAYVGGGYSGNLHNILEPAVFGLPIVFGPKYSKFPEAQLFIDNGFGFSTNSKTEIISAFQHILHNRIELSSKAKTLVAQNTGASESIYNAIFSAN